MTWHTKQLKVRYLMLKTNVMIKGQNHYNTVNSDGCDGRTLPSTRKKYIKQGSSPSFRRKHACLITVME